jgi:hypothetical protein
MLLVIILVDKAAGEDAGGNTAGDILYHRQFVESLYFWLRF